MPHSHIMSLFTNIQQIHFTFTIIIEQKTMFSVVALLNCDILVIIVIILFGIASIG